MLTIYCKMVAVAGSFVNVFLDPVLMFSLHLGVGGAAVATVVSE